MKLEDIRRHWEHAGKRDSFASEVTPTSRDPYLGQLERRNILQHLSPEQAVLEVGCGDASHSVCYAARVRSLCALDVAESLIQRARERAAARGAEIEFLVSSVLDMGSILADRAFDCVISQRCIINLPDWEHQKEALRQMSEALNEGGLLLLSEGFQQELENLNDVREALGLERIAVVDYNRNLDRDLFEDFILDRFELVERRHYGPYLFLSRVYHPLAVLPETPKHDSRLNQVAGMISEKVNMPDMERFSYNLFYALRKR